MNDQTSGDVAPRASAGDALSERVICVVARDVLSLDHRDAEFDGLLTAVWNGRWLILASVVIFAMAATAYGLLATNWYLAETVLTPVSQTNVNGLTSQLGNLSMLTSLAGINFQQGNDTAEALGVLKSRDFTRQFIEQQELLHVLLWKDWNAQTGRWKESDARHQPDIRDAINYFKQSVLIVSEDRKTGFVTLGIRWRDPRIAASWANMIVDRLNAQMRARALSQGETNIEYLRKELAGTSQSTLQSAIAQLIEAQMQRVMLARSDPDFAFRVIDHAEVPKLRSWPKRRIVLALGILAGGFVGLMIAFIRESLRRRSPRRPEQA